MEMRYYTTRRLSGYGMVIRRRYLIHSNTEAHGDSGSGECRAKTEALSRGACKSHGITGHGSLICNPQP